MGKPLLECRRLDVGYPTRTVLKEVYLTLERGDVLGIVGPNGSGKSTLLKTLLGVLEPLSGQLEWTGEPRFGYVPQQEELEHNWPLSVEELVLMGRFPERGPFRRLHTVDRERARSALEEVNVGLDGSRNISELSGGEFQRVLLARALAAEPEVVLLDEPTSAVDLQGTTDLLRTIQELGERHDWTTILVSHDLNLTARLADRLALLHEGSVHVGETEEITSVDRLETVFETSVEVVEGRDGRRIVLPDLTRTEGSE